MLQQLQCEAGDGVDSAASESVEASVERVRRFVDKTRAGVPTTSTESEPATQSSEDNQKSEEQNQESQSVTEFVAEPSTELTRDLMITEEVSSKNYSENNVVAVSNEELSAPIPDLIRPQRQVSGNNNQLPDIVCDTLRATNKHKRKSPRRRSFRLNTLRTQKKPETPAPLPTSVTWTSVGRKLAEISNSLDTPVGTRRPSLPPPSSSSNIRSRPEATPRRNSCNPRMLFFGTNDDIFGGEGASGVDTEHIVNNVLKVVQVVGLFLVMKKFENMLK